MANHNVTDPTLGRGMADSLRAGDFAPSHYARMRAIAVTATPARLNDLLGATKEGADPGPSRGVTKLRLWPRGEKFWLKRDPAETLTHGEFEADSEYLIVGEDADLGATDVSVAVLILPDNPWLMLAQGYGYGADTTVLVEEL